MNDFKFADDTKYNIQNALDYRVSIQLNLDGFSFLMTDSECHVLKIQHLNTGSIEESIEIFRQDNSLDELTRISFNKLEILINTNQFTLIPEALFNEKDKKFLLSHSIQLNEGDSIESASIKDLKSHAIYSLNTKLQDFIQLFKNSPRISHLSSVILPYALKKTDGNGMSLYTAGKMLHICDYSNNELQFYNVFPYNDSKELLFHILNTTKKLNIETGSKNIYYSGDINSESENYRSIVNYIPDLQVFPNEFSFEIAGDLNENYFSTLLASLNCVS